MSNGPSSHYFEPHPATPSDRRTVALVLPDLSVNLISDRAVFSVDRIDPGSKYLLLEVPPPSSTARHGLDLGCGYGPLAVTMASRLPADGTVWAVDSNERAVALCRANAEALGLPSVHASAVSGDRPWGDVPDTVEFDVIWSNPPIRVGKAALHELLSHWLPRLAPEGHAYLVVQKHLGADSLQRWLTEQGWAAARLGSRAGYRLLDVHREPPG